MSYLIDSDWLIDVLNRIQSSAQVLNGLRSQGLFVCIITVGEIYDGAFLAPDPQQRLTAYRTFLSNFSIVGLTDDVMEVFARERTALRQKGQLIPDMDLLIAATAITHDLTLVTRNMRHFSRIPDLKLYQGA